MDLASDLKAILFIAAVCVGLVAVGLVMNLVSLVASRRPSEVGVRLMLAMPGLAMVVVGLFGAFFFVTVPQAGTPAFFASFVSGLVLGSLLLVAGVRASVSTARTEVATRTPAVRRAAPLLAIYLTSVSLLAWWAVLTVPSHLHTSVVAVSFAGTLGLFGVYLFARLTEMPFRLRFGALEGASVLFAIAVVSLLGTLILLTLDLPG